MSRYEQDVSRKSLKEQRLERQLEATQALLEDKEGAFEAAMNVGDRARAAVHGRAINRIGGTIGRIETRIQTERDVAYERAHTRGVNTLERYAQPEAITADINRYAGTTAAYSQSQQFQGVSYAELERRRASVQNTAQAASQGMMRIFEDQDMSTQQKTRALNRLEGIRQGALQQGGAMDVQMRTLRQLGVDPISQDKTFAQLASRARTFVGERDIAEKVSSGDIAGASGTSAKDMRGLMSEYTGIQQKIIDSQKKLAEINDKTSQSAEKLRGELGKLAEQSYRVADTMKEVQAQGGGGGRGRLIAGLEMASQLGQDIAGSVMNMAVNQPIEGRRLRTEFANLGTQQYRDVQGAIGGDIKSMMMLGSFSRNKAFADAIGSRTNAAVGISTAADTAGAIAKGVQNAAGGTDTFFSGKVQAATEGAGDAAQIAANIKSQMQGLPAGQQVLRGAKQDRAMTEALATIPAEMMQNYVDFQRGAGQASLGLGGDLRSRDAFIRDMGNQREAAAAIGLTGARQAEITAAGVQALGADFTAADTVSMRQLERTGRGSIEQNLQRRQALQMMGMGKQDDLEDVIKMGMERGLNSAKSIDMLVQATSATAQRLSDVGINVGKETASMLTAAAGGGTPAEIRRAQSAMEFANQNAGALNMSMVTLMERQQIGASFGGKLTNMQTTNLQGATMQELNALMHGTEKEKRKMAEEMGFSGDATEMLLGKEGQERLAGLRKAKVRKILTGGRFGLQDDKNIDQIVDAYITSGGNLDNIKDPDLRARAKGLVRGVADSGALASISSGAAASGKGQEINGVSQEVRYGEQAAGADIKAYKEGEKGVRAAGGMEGLNKSMDEMVKKFDASEFKKLPEKMAESFRVNLDAANKMASAVDHFEKVVTGMQQRAGATTVSEDISDLKDWMSDKLSPIMNQYGGSDNKTKNQTKGSK